MSVPAAYLGVILIWATTPLAIQWSGDGPGFLFGVASRMAIGALLALAFARLTGVRVWRREALGTYAVVGLGIYGAMLSTYWAAQQIPSGWISVIFGFTPIATGAMAALWLPDQGLTRLRLAGALLGMGGLAAIFSGGASAHGQAALGISAVLLATLIHAASAVWTKRLGAGLRPLAMVAGGLAFSTPPLVATWAVFDGSWPAALPERALASILYLGVVGSVLGFSLFYYVLGRVDATRVALITLVTPVAALLLGHVLNDEPLSLRVIAGAGLVIAGLAVFELGDRWARRRPRSLPQPEIAP
jgi:drug/metabolite transporter (DMT)-like permease